MHDVGFVCLLMFWPVKVLGMVHERGNHRSFCFKPRVAADELWGQFTSSASSKRAIYPQFSLFGRLLEPKPNTFPRNKSLHRCMVNSRKRSGRNGWNWELQTPCFFKREATTFITYIINVGWCERKQSRRRRREQSSRDAWYLVMDGFIAWWTTG